MATLLRMFMTQSVRRARGLRAGPAGGNLVWAPDGKHLVFGYGDSIFRVRSDGVGEAERLLEGQHGAGPWSFSPDGRWLAYFNTTSETGSDIWVLPLDMRRPRSPEAGCTPAVPAHNREREFSDVLS